MTDMVAEIARLLASAPTPKRRELRCGEAIFRWLQSKPAAPPARGSFPGDGAISSFFGTPILLDPGLGRGTWSFTEDGEEVQRGQVGDGDRVWFIPALGQFVTTDDDALAEAFDGAPDRLHEQMAARAEARAQLDDRPWL